MDEVDRQARNIILSVGIVASVQTTDAVRNTRILLLTLPTE